MSVGGHLCSFEERLTDTGYPIKDNLEVEHHAIPRITPCSFLVSRELNLTQY
jgi:hypothetical protein